MSRQLHISARGIDAGTTRRLTDDAAVSPAPAAVLSAVTVAYGRRRRAVAAVADLTLRIARGETLALVGPTGAGKSTILRAVAGLAPRASGQLTISDPVRMVVTVDAVDAAARTPLLLLIDGDRPDLIDDVSRLRSLLPTSTIVFAPDDPADALGVADRIVVLDRGRLIDVGTPGDLWDHPPSAFTARLLGDANLIDCTIGRVYGASAMVSVGDRMMSAIAYPPSGTRRWAPGSAAYVCIRPYDIEVCADSAAGASTARILTTRWRGASTRLTLAVDGLPDQPVIADVAGRAMYRPESAVGVKFPAQSCVLVPSVDA